MDRQFESGFREIEDAFAGIRKWEVSSFPQARPIDAAKGIR